MHGSVKRGGDRLEKCLVFNVRPHWLKLLRQVNELEFGSLAIAGLEVLWNSALESRAQRDVRVNQTSSLFSQNNCFGFS